ncbi:MAG: histidine kinase [Sphaerochaetaceae bacterium]|nr:histidine kinase [Spirochaetales bacterium]MDY5499746.1 histidine kinase [Sphaerochaetaceae bacterium]
MKKRISTHLLLLVVGLIILPFALLFVGSLLSYERVIQNELSQRIIGEVRHSNDELNRLFEKMVNLSTIFANDEDFGAEFTTRLPGSYYDHYKAFANVCRSIELQNLYDDMLDHVSIRFQDNAGLWYSNQPFSPEEQRALEQAPWVEESKRNQGFAVWNQDDGVSYARELYGLNGDIQPLGTMVVSIGQSFLWRILASYSDAEDSVVFATDERNNPVIFNPEKPVPDIASLEEGHRIVRIDDTSYLAIVFFLEPEGIASHMTFKICYLYGWDHIKARSAAMVRASAFLLFAFLVASLVIASLITSWITHPIQKLSNQMRHFLVGNSVAGPPAYRDDEIGEIERSFQQMAQNTNALFAHLEQEHKEKEHYYYESLSARLNPHFLFNTLHTMRWMAVIRKADNIRQCIDALTRILQYHLSDTSSTTLRDELTVLDSYAFIQATRFGDRISYAQEVPPELFSARMLKFSLQPIVENCWKHAFPAGQSACHIVVRARKAGGTLEIDVVDNGTGFSPEAKSRFLSHKETANGGKGGIGLSSIDRMIDLVYGRPYGVSLVDVPKGSIVRLSLPYEEGTSS